MDKMARKIIISVALFSIFSLICINETNSHAITPNKTKNNDTSGMTTVVAAPEAVVKSISDENISVVNAVEIENTTIATTETPLNLTANNGKISRRKGREVNVQRKRSVQYLLEMVRAQNAVGCVQKVICELSADINAHGEDGRRFGRSLLLLEGEADANTREFYRQAATTGTALKNARLCVRQYPSCQMGSLVLIQIANQFIDA